ncbi:MAG: lumazine-binding protein [Actinomycetia bacterium]|nr:lumazine-binding protein [Actinomycetes bacterium]MCH9703119.1 lumazine-binding protein [Actinomycetes bacterium]MCH9760039.1 lumazine-binding protein [Actinomycetes bacterium]
MTDPADSSSGGTTAAPFLAALAIAVTVVIVVWLFNVFSGDELTDDQQIRLAVVAQNDALQRQDYADFRAYTCVEKQGFEPEIIAGQRDSVENRGERFIDSANGIAIDGDRATAEVTYHFSKDPDRKETVEIAFERQDGAWKVCSTGPN